MAAQLTGRSLEQPQTHYRDLLFTTEKVYYLLFYCIRLHTLISLLLGQYVQISNRQMSDSGSNTSSGMSFACTYLRFYVVPFQGNNKQSGRVLYAKIL